MPIDHSRDVDPRDATDHSAIGSLEFIPLSWLIKLARHRRADDPQDPEPIAPGS